MNQRNVVIGGAGPADPILWGAVMTLVFGGLVTVYSSSAFFALKHQQDQFYFLTRQAGFAAVGLMLMYFFSVIPHQILKGLAPWMLGLAVILLLAVYSPAGITVQGASRWVGYGSFRFQSSEFAKFALIIFLAHSLSMRAKRDVKKLNSFFQGFLLHLLVPGLILFLIVIEPNFGQTLLTGMVVCAMLFIAGVRTAYLLGALTAAVPTVIVISKFFPHVAQRLEMFMKAKDFIFNREELNQLQYQIRESIISIGSGGWSGLGLGQGTMKIFFLPQAHSDFAFATLAQETGFIGTTAVVAIYLVILHRGYIAALRAHTPFGTYTAFGITTLIGFQALVNICVVLGLMPPTGLVLPFISYGGSALLVMLAAMGVLLNISRDGAPVPERSLFELDDAETAEVTA